MRFRFSRGAARESLPRLSRTLSEALFRLRLEDVPKLLLVQVDAGGRRPAQAIGLAEQLIQTIIDDGSPGVVSFSHQFTDLF